MDERSTQTAVARPTCRWCGAWHGPRCPTVQAIEYHPDGTVKRVEFVKPESIDWQRAAEMLPPAQRERLARLIEDHGWRSE